MTSGSLLIIFTKNPEPGLVKTRLARSIGDEKALEVYEKHGLKYTGEWFDLGTVDTYRKIVDSYMDRRIF